MDQIKQRQGPRQTSILSYWTVRYLLIISIGLVITALATFFWIRQEVMENRMQTAGLLAQEIADRSPGPGGLIENPQRLGPLLEDRQQFFRLTADMCIIAVGKDGHLLFSQPVMDEERMRYELNEELTDARSPEFRAASAPIPGEAGAIGQVFVMQSKRSLSFIPSEEIFFFAVMLVVLAVLSWLTIYLLSRKLSGPIRRVAAAAAEISGGRYDISLEPDAKEREINELLASFRDMAGKLHQYEQSRAVMLAGVSHELKTPVTSIKGLVHAVREKVVEGDEAEEFLDIALHESERLQRMVADLLDYNALAAGTVSVRRDRLEASPLLGEIVHQWRLAQTTDIAEPVLLLPERPVYIRGDALRIQQILVNLLNNSLQAKQAGVPLALRIKLAPLDRDNAEIEVSDNGAGIVAQHRERVFESFFRGSGGTGSTRGMGLGLPFSRLLAEAMDGTLELLPSGTEGSSFRLTLPRCGKRAGAPLRTPGLPARFTGKVRRAGRLSSL